MWMTVAGLVVGFVGLFFGVCGVFIAYKQNFIANQLKTTLADVKKKREQEIWTQIGIDLTAFDALDESRSLLSQSSVVDQEIEIRRKIESARRATIDLYRLLLCEAVGIEPVFTMNTIKKWRNAGRLENEWRVRTAMRLLPTREIPGEIPSVGNDSRPTDMETGEAAGS